MDSHSPLIPTTYTPAYHQPWYLHPHAPLYTHPYTLFNLSNISHTITHTTTTPHLTHFSAPTQWTCPHIYTIYMHIIWSHRHVHTAWKNTHQLLHTLETHPHLHLHTPFSYAAVHRLFLGSPWFIFPSFKFFLLVTPFHSTSVFPIIFYVGPLNNTFFFILSLLISSHSFHLKSIGLKRKGLFHFSQASN